MSSTLSDDKSRDGESPGQEGIRLSQRLSTAESIWVSESLSLTREAAFVAVVCMAQFCTQAAYMGTLVLLRTIGESFHVDSPPRLAWLVGGYSLTVGTFILFSGRLGDIFGYKRMLLTGLAWFSLWSLVAGLSVYSSYTLAVFSRVLQGIGPAICLPNALAILGASYAPGHRKAMVFAFFGAVAPIGGVVGGLFASLLTLAWWPWALWAMAARAGRRRRPRALQLCLDPGARQRLGHARRRRAPGAGPAALRRLCRRRVPPQPQAAAAPRHGQRRRGLCAGRRGLRLGVVWRLDPVPGAAAAGRPRPVAAAHHGLVRPPYVMAMALSAFTLGSVLTATTPADQVYWGQTFVSMIVMPFGMDMSFPAATLILSNTVPKRHQGVGASLVNTVVNYGIALGVGFAGTVEVQVHGDGATPDAQLRGFRGALYMGVGLAGLGLAVSLLFVARERIWKRGGRA
ncbi:MFS transporter [Metarhizium acridum CQMa 102]|uniref:MFS transporter n=1 Tax=Metarhizium acridum (strain CQMa 102) TaxID=655827 RepID=E9EAA6_METAQ|nr:MFS transporter [Metarhizium acridum CQMa 102]EFY87127.1 MFS transporter [Metarhizium acridum CQMa 102]